MKIHSRHDRDDLPHVHLLGRRLAVPLSRRARLVSFVFLSGAMAMVPWTAYLDYSLPPKFVAGHWDLLWTGFDSALIVVLALAGLAAWFRRQILAALAIVAGVLLLCDAWFDILTSIGHRDEVTTWITGFGVEVPLALFFFWLYHRIVMHTLTVVYTRLGDEAPPRHLRDAQILFDPEPQNLDVGDR